MKDELTKKNYTRRNFVETGLAGAAGVAIGLAAGKILIASTEEAPEMVKMLTADGKLVQVEKRHLPTNCGNPVPVSNKDLQDWMDKGKL